MASKSSRPASDSAPKHRWAWEGGGFFALFGAMVGMSLGAEPGTKDFRAVQSGLLTFILFTALLVPARVRWWLAVHGDRSFSAQTKWGKYLFSGRFFLDLSISLAVVTFVFLLDLSFWPQHTVRLGVASAISLVGLGVGLLARPRRNSGH